MTGWSDDEAGVMATYAARSGPGAFAHEFVTTPGVLAVVDGVLAGVLIGILTAQLSANLFLTLGAAVTGAVLVVALLAVFQFRGAVRPRADWRPRFPDETSEEVPA